MELAQENQLPCHVLGIIILHIILYIKYLTKKTMLRSRGIRFSIGAPLLILSAVIVNSPILVKTLFSYKAVYYRAYVRIKSFFTNRFC